MFFKFVAGAPQEPWVTRWMTGFRLPLTAALFRWARLGLWRERPDQKLGKIPLRGIGFAQDVGGAIKSVTASTFSAAGNERANYVASHLDAKGPAWILLAKDLNRKRNFHAR